MPISLHQSPETQQLTNYWGSEKISASIWLLFPVTFNLKVSKEEKYCYFCFTNGEIEAEIGESGPCPEAS